MAEDRTVFQAPTDGRVGAGTRLSDLYEIDAPLAVGGMGEVFRGHVIETGDAVAIKVMRPEFAQNADALALFRKEASALHNVHHSAVVRYYVFSVDRQLGLPFLAMEYVTGDSLADRLRRGPLDYEEVETLRRRVASGLAAAHEAGIVHRDVTPDNIILPAGAPERAKIIDFGIARLAQTKTVIGTGFAGKYAYASPEQFGLQGGEVTLRSDIYSLGLVLAQASRGRALDMGDAYPGVIAKRSAVPDLTGVDVRLVPLLSAMLQPDPGLRPSNMQEIERWGDPVTRMTPGENRMAAARKPRRRLPLVIGALALAFAGATGAVFFFGQIIPPPAPDTGPPITEKNPPKGSSPTSDGIGLPTPPIDVPLPPIDVPPPPEKPGGTTGNEAVNPPSGPSPDPPPPPSVPAPATAEMVAAYIRGYRGGECFVLNPVAVTADKASVEAYGSAPDPFKAFDQSFRETFGFDAQIYLRQVERGQCPIVDLLAIQAQGKSASVPKLRIEKDRLRNGGELRGTADFGGSPNTALLLVDRDGRVHDLGRYLKRSGRQANFAIRLEASPSSSGLSQLVVAVESQGSIGALRDGSTNAAALYDGLVQEATRRESGFGLAVSQIKIGE